MRDIFEKPKKFIKSLIHGRRDYSPSIKKLLNEIGDETIRSIQIQRAPISDSTNTILNIISLGRFKKQNPYDKLFHLSILVNGRVRIEKEESPKIRILPQEKPNTEKLDVMLPSTPITIRELVENTRIYMGDDKFFVYNANNNNCQEFIKSLLIANNLDTTQNIEFVKQDVNQIFRNLGYLRKIANTITDTFARLDVLKEGGSISPHNGLNTLELDQLLSEKKDYHGAYSKDKLPKNMKNGWYIINMEDHDGENGGTHWTCFKYQKKKPIEYYDSFGFPPPLEVMKLSKNDDILYSNKQIQDIKSTACGWFCVARILADHIKYKDFINMFSDRTELNDKILGEMLMELGVQ